jgi:hypothetical protein
MTTILREEMEDLTPLSSKTETSVVNDALNRFVVFSWQKPVGANALYSIRHCPALSYLFAELVSEDETRRGAAKPKRYLDT